MNADLKNAFAEGAYKKFSILFISTCIISIILIYFDYREYEHYKELIQKRSHVHTRVYPNPLATETENRIIFLLNKIEQAKTLKEVEKEFKEIENIDPDNAYITVLKMKLVLGEGSYETESFKDWKELKIIDREKVFQALELLSQIVQQHKYNQYRLVDAKCQIDGLKKNWPAVSAHAHHNHMLYGLATIRSITKIIAALPDDSKEKNLTHIKNIIHLKDLLLQNEPVFFNIYFNSALNKILLLTLIEEFPHEFQKEIQEFQTQIGAQAHIDSTRLHHLSAHFQYFFDSNFDRQAFYFKYGGRIQLLFFNKLADRFSLIILLVLVVFAAFLYLRYWKLITRFKDFFTFPDKRKIIKTFLILFIVSLIYSVILSFILRDPSTDDNVCSLSDYVDGQMSLLFVLKFIFLNLTLILPIIYLSHKNRTEQGNQTHWTMTLIFPVSFLTFALLVLYIAANLLEWRGISVYPVIAFEAFILIILLLKYYKLFVKQKSINVTLQNVYRSIIYLCIFCLSQQILASTFYRSIEAYHFDYSLFYVPNLEKGSCEMAITHQQIDLYYKTMEESPFYCLGKYRERIKDFPLKRMRLVEEFSEEDKKY